MATEREEVLTVFVRGLEVYAYHGVPAEERVLGHRYRVEVRLQVRSSAQWTDDVGDTVDYGAIGQLVERTVRETQFQTLERLGAAVLDALMQSSERVLEAEVGIEKPHPPAPIIAEATGVVMRRGR
jgi:dihydroneopterin aldolase